MGIKGGYKVIDFKGAALSTTPTTMTEVLADLLNNYGKVVLLSGVNIGGEVLSECFSCVLSDGDDGVKLNCYDGYIIVTKEGAVTYTNANISAIPSIESDINKLKSLNTNLINGNNQLISNFNKLNQYETLSAFMPGAYINTIFGVNANANVLITKLSDTGALIVIFTTLNENIFKGVVTISGTNVAWSGRYVFEGIEYTPA